MASFIESEKHRGYLDSLYVLYFAPFALNPDESAVFADLLKSCVKFAKLLYKIFAMPIYCSCSFYGAEI